eukprot:GSMAST32.ASY1.ANO1.252.1 assembled CDS
MSENNTSMDANDGKIAMRVKTLGNEVFHLRVEPDIPIKDLRSMLVEKTQVPEEKQRLIFQGKLLKDEELLSKYKFKNNMTLHMIARPTLPTSTNNGETSSVDSTSSTVDQNSSHPGIVALPPITISIPRQVQQEGTPPSTEGETNNRAGSLDTFNSQFAQALSSLSQTARTEVMNSAQSEEPQKKRSMSKHRKFSTGQWLDVKDTVQQWLEATVISCSKTHLYIHYNGWPSRWDEWIPMDSNRVAPFRTKTRKASAGPFMSPSPTSWVPNCPSTGPNDSQYAINSVNRMVSNVVPLLNKFCTLSNSMNSRTVGFGDEEKVADDKYLQNSQEEKVELKKYAVELAPLIDRVGRLISDIAPLVSEIAKTEKVSCSSQVEESAQIDTKENIRSIRSSESDNVVNTGSISSDQNDVVDSSSTLRSGSSADTSVHSVSIADTSNAYAQLVSIPSQSPAYSNSGNNIGIHIQAVVADSGMTNMPNRSTGQAQSNETSQRPISASTNTPNNDTQTTNPPDMVHFHHSLYP